MQKASGRELVPPLGGGARSALAKELQLLLRRGFDVAQLIESPTLLAFVGAAGLPGNSPVMEAATLKEHLLTSTSQLAPGDREAALALLGLAERSSGQSLTMRRKLAAQTLGIADESFRRHRERRLLEDLATMLLLNLQQSGEAIKSPEPRALSSRAGVDVFLSYSSGDADTFARPLAAALQREGVSVWLDRDEIRPGDDIVRKIEGAIRRSRFILVMLTEHALKSQDMDAELARLISYESNVGDEVLIPVFATSVAEVIERFPALRYKAGLSWSDGIPHIVKNIANLFDRRPAKWWSHSYENQYSGPVWVRVIPSADHLDEEHHLELTWGPWVYETTLKFNNHEPVSLMHNLPIGQQLLPVYARIDPPAVVTFGEGSASDSRQIDSGWTRASGT